MLSLLGLATSLAYIPGITGNALPTGWAILSLTLSLTLWIKADMTPFHTAGAAFLAYVAWSITWTPEPWDGLYTLWHFIILALAFRLGNTDLDLRPLWKGLAIGVGISSCVAALQYLGYTIVPTATPYAGIYYNGVASGAISAVAIVALLTIDQWYWVAILIPGLLLSGSRGAIFAAAFGTLLTFHRRAWVALIPLGAASIITYHLGPSDIQRFTIWSAALNHLDFWGNGAGSFLSVLMQTPHGLQHPEYAHNDYLQLVFEFGIGTLFLIPFVIPCAQYQHSLFPILGAVFLLAMVAMPLHIPVVAFVFAVASGRLCRDWTRTRFASDLVRPSIPIESDRCRQALPLELGLPQSELTP